MIKMTYQNFMSFGFTQVMTKLAQTPLPVKVSYQIKRMIDDMEKARKAIKDEYLEMVKAHAVLNEKGELKLKEGTDQFEIDPAKQVAYTEAEKAFGEKEVTIDRFPIHVDHLEGANFSAGELTALHGVVTDTYQVPAAPGENVVPMHS